MSPKAFAAALQKNRKQKLLFVTGAGMSFASGIPTFRGTDKDAVWKKDVTELGTVRFFYEDPVESWRWYQSRFDSLENKKPNAGHAALVALEKWQRQQGEFLLVTQNIDTLHEDAGSNDFVKVHGSADKVRCPEAECEMGGATGSLLRSDFDVDAFRQNPSPETAPKCPNCSAILRQHVLWFDEYYQSHRDYQWQRVKEAMREMTMLVFAGTSFSVGVTESFLRSAQYLNIPIFSINPAKEMQPHPAVMCIEQKIEEFLPQVVTALHETDNA